MTHARKATRDGTSRESALCVKSRERTPPFPAKGPVLSLCRNNKAAEAGVRLATTPLSSKSNK